MWVYCLFVGYSLEGDNIDIRAPTANCASALFICQHYESHPYTCDLIYTNDNTSGLISHSPNANEYYGMQVDLFINICFRVYSMLSRHLQINYVTHRGFTTELFIFIIVFDYKTAKMRQCRTVVFSCFAHSASRHRHHTNCLKASSMKTVFRVFSV